jgi:hypothetical protein
VKLLSVAIFGAGYVLGTKAGRERYEQIVAAAQNAPEKYEQIRSAARTLSQRLEEYGSGGGWAQAGGSNGRRPSDDKS